MKKIIFIGINIFMCCLICKNTFAQTTLINNKQTSTFGRYGDCTTGRGICGIDTDNLNSRSTSAKFCIEKENDSTLIVKIFHNRISFYRLVGTPTEMRI